MPRIANARGLSDSVRPSWSSGKPGRTHMSDAVAPIKVALQPWQATGTRPSSPSICHRQVLGQVLDFWPRLTAGYRQRAGAPAHSLSPDGDRAYNVTHKRGSARRSVKEEIMSHWRRRRGAPVLDFAAANG